MSTHCCDRMDDDLLQNCEYHLKREDCPDALIAEVRSGYGLIVHDGTGSIIEISFCPWCGAKLHEIAPISLDAISK